MDVKSGPLINAVVDAHHASAGRMFTYPIRDKNSAATYVIDTIKRVTK